MPLSQSCLNLGEQLISSLHMSNQQKKGWDSQ